MYQTSRANYWVAVRRSGQSVVGGNTDGQKTSRRGARFRPPGDPPRRPQASGDSRAACRSAGAFWPTIQSVISRWPRSIAASDWAAASRCRATSRARRGILSAASIAGSKRGDASELYLFVRVRGVNGRAVEAVYEMVNESGRWRINGVVTRPDSSEKA